MNKKTVATLLLSTLIILVGVPESFARPQYLTSLNEVYGGGSCGTCHIDPNGGGPRNAYGISFQNQPNHRADPGAAFTAIGQPPTASSTFAPTATSTIEPATTEVTAVTARVTPAAPGFGIVVSVVGLFACALLVKRHNK
ncbi:MAG TPA: PGF-CTERM sorting domain-containing protein [Candidatus Methanoperedens sp.]